MPVFGGCGPDGPGRAGPGTVDRQGPTGAASIRHTLAPACHRPACGPTASAADRTGPARDRISALGRAFNGRAGISVVSLSEGWQADYNAATLFPQQSCSKLWVAITAMDAVDKGRLSLSDKVTLGRNDLTLFHQPISAKVLGGGHTTTLSALMFTAITESDNTANDKLMRSIGGPQAVRDMISSKNLGSIRFYDGELRCSPNRRPDLEPSYSTAMP